MISAEDVGLGSPWPQWWWMPFTAAAGSSPGTAPIINCFFVHAVRYLCALPEGAGSSVLASVVKRRIRRGDPFPLPDYKDMQQLTGQSKEHRPLPGRGRPCPAGGPGHGGGAGGDRALGAGARADERGSEAQQDRT